jgi:hypothetical protein
MRITHGIEFDPNDSANMLYDTARNGAATPLDARDDRVGLCTPAEFTMIRWFRLTIIPTVVQVAPNANFNGSIVDTKQTQQYSSTPWNSH